jgi:hypothetical protein
MAIIKIQRTSDYINLMRDYRLFIDGQKIGSIGNAQIKDFEIPAGRHSVIAKIDWCSSPELSFEINEHDSKTLLVGTLKIWRWIIPLLTGIIALSFIVTLASRFYYTILLILPPFLLLLYYLTFGRKNYLTLRERDKITA